MSENAWLLLIGILVVPTTLCALILTVAIRKKWRLKIVVPLLLSFSIMIVGLMLWIGVRENWILLGTLAFSVFQGFIIYAWLPKHWGDRSNSN